MKFKKEPTIIAVLKYMNRVELVDILYFILKHPLLYIQGWRPKWWTRQYSTAFNWEGMDLGNEYGGYWRDSK